MSGILNSAEIPVIDIGALRRGEPDAARVVADQMLAAAEHLGFFYVSEHGVENATLDDAQREARAFFALPNEEKLRAEINVRHRGFLQVGEAKMHGAQLPDLKESFIWGVEVSPKDPNIAPDNPFLGENNWPPGRASFRRALSRYFEQVSGVGIDLLRAFAVSMDIDEHTFSRSFDYPISRGSAIHYPPLPEASPDDESECEQFGVSPHTDFGCITVLYQDPIGGLEVRARDGQWIAATPVDGTFVVNIGDLLARWTNDRFQSTAHRVRNLSSSERLSLGVFVDPNFETVIDPAVVCRTGETPKYPPVRCGDYVLERYAGAFAYRQAEK